MKNKLLDNIINSMRKELKYDEIKLKEIRYGLESFYLTISKITVIFIISIFIKTTKELALLFLFYGLLRLTGFGAHAKKTIQCWIISVILFACFPLLIKFLYIPKILSIILSLFLLIFIYKYAPADTEKRPLINKKKRELYKYLSVLICLIYISIIIYTSNQFISNLLLFSILTETIFILPITYKLLNLKYNNYLYYKRKEDAV